MTIDTLAYVKKLEAAGLDRNLAEAHVEALKRAVTRKPARRSYTVANRIERQVAHPYQSIDARLQLLTWMVGFNLAATITVLLILQR
jgi:hypothetical protein